jgi:predicted metal-dependent HD superfamily phosphohydrolase
VRVLGIEVAPALEAEVRRLHANPLRAYHDFTHVEEVLGHLAWAQKQGGVGDAATLVASALLHDAIYVAGASDNEERSAELARQLLPTHLAAANVSATKRIIRLTTRHGHTLTGLTADEAVFLDADLAILGASAERFDAYDVAIAAEYAPVVPPDVFAAGRRHFLSRLLESPRFYQTDLFHHAFDAAARANLQRAVSR